MEYQRCSRCVMDTTALDIRFDENGVCNYCSEFEEELARRMKTVEHERLHREEFIDSIKRAGRRSEYDCVVGVSGGVDSSYALLLSKDAGLRPLAVHLDNGWNSELAVHNIHNLVNKLDVDLHTHVIDWPENRDLQLSFMRAGVVDIELLMDNAMLKLNYMMADKFGIKYILAGTNMATEGMRMPPDWSHFKLDKRNIIAIHKRFGTQKVRTHPLLSVFGYLYYEAVRKIHWISFLDYFPYVKEDALRILSERVNYRPYPYKHYESIFTRFYQGYILPRKFGVDKRKVHFSTLIVSGQMTRAKALELLEDDPYPDLQQLQDDKSFVQKKLNISVGEMNKYIQDKPIQHASFASEFGFYKAILRLARKYNLKKVK